LLLVCTRDKETGVFTGLRSSVLGILYTALLITVFVAGKCCVFALNYNLPFKFEKRSLILSELLICVIYSVITLIASLTKIRKGMNTLLNKISIVDELIYTHHKVLERNESFLRVQIITLTFIVCIIYLNDFSGINSDINTWAINLIMIYIYAHSLKSLLQQSS
jgi:hypothetical protein